MQDIRYYQRYIEWAAGALQDYLLSEDLFWKAELRARPGESPYPELTIETLNLTIRKYLALKGEGKPAIRQDEWVSRIETIHEKWKVAWERKAERCYRSRVNLWLNYLRDYKECPDANADRYPYEVRHRVFIELLGMDLRLDISLSAIGKSDRFLKTILEPGDFIWEKEIKSGFPKPQFWFLYGSLPSRLLIEEISIE
jgi:hypothetical protein